MMTMLYGWVALALAAIPVETHETLNEAIRRGDLQAVSSILKRYPKLATTKPNRHESPLHVAVKRGNAAMAELLLDRGCPLNERDSGGNTPLHDAAGAAAVKLLVSRGAQINAKNKHGQTPLEVFAQRPYPGAVKALRDLGSPIDFDSAVKAGLVDDVERILAKEPWLPKRPSHCLFDALRSGNLTLVPLLLKHGADVNHYMHFMNVAGPYSPLTYAVTDDHYDIARSLCEAGANCNVSGGRNHPILLLYSLGFQEPKYTELLLKHGASVALAGWGENGITPLHIAASQGGRKGASTYTRVGEPSKSFSRRDWALAKVKALLKAGADPACVTKSGVMPIHHAILAENHDVVKHLLSLSVKPDIFAAAALGRLDDVKSMLAVKAGLAKEAQLLGYPLLHWAILSDSLPMVQLILAHGGHPNQPGTVLEFHPSSGFSVSRDGEETSRTETALSLAVQRQRLEIVQALLAAGASVDGDALEYCPPIAHACASRKLEMVQLILKYKPKLNRGGKDRCPPLATSLLSPPMAKLLLDHGASPNIQLQYESLLDHAVGHKEYHPAAELLVLHGATLNLKQACQFNNVEAVRRILAKDPDLLHKQLGQYEGSALTEALRAGSEEVAIALLDMKSTYGSYQDRHSSPLHVAAEKGLVRVTQRLINEGANVNALDRYYNTPLHVGARFGQVEIVKLLLRHGANVHQRGSQGDTALHECAEFSDFAYEATAESQVATSEVLIQAGAKLDVRNAWGDMPHHEAAKDGKLALFKWLVEHGADIHAKNWQDMTAIELAREPRHRVFNQEKDHEGVIRFLVERGVK